MKNLAVVGPTFIKMSGAGNDFLILDMRSESANGADAFKGERQQLVVELCKRVASVGADGLLFLESAKENQVGDYDAVWDFYNADGSMAEMCGNAARCVIKYLWRERSAASAMLKASDPIRLLTRSGEVSGQVFSDGLVEVVMGKIDNRKWNQNIVVLGKDCVYDFIDSGVPHVVLQVNDLSATDHLIEQAQFIQDATEFSPHGTNVTFYQIIEKGIIHSTSFERGVRGFTLACGTGAVASSLAYLNLDEEINDQLAASVEVHVPGGQLAVKWNGFIPILKGEARFLYDFRLYENKNHLM